MTNKLVKNILSADIQFYNNFSVACMTAGVLTPPATFVVYAFEHPLPRITSHGLIALGVCLLWCVFLCIATLKKRDRLVRELNNRD